MKAMILATRKGPRVRPITHIVPKPKIQELQKIVIEVLREYCSTETMVNVSEPEEFTENYLGDGQRFGVEIVELDRQTKTMADSSKSTQEMI